MTAASRRDAAFLLLAALAAGPTGARAQEDARPPPLREVDVEERLSAQVPLGLEFRDAEGRAVALRDVLGHGRPTVLSLVYYECPMLCGLVLSGLSRGLRESGLELGKDYRALAVSFDPREKPPLARERQRGHLQSLGIPGRSEAWPFLTGEEREIEALTDAVGFRYAYDEATKQYAHPAVLVVLTPGGKVSRYLYGVEFAGRDLRLALVEAGEGRVGTSLDRLLLTCYRYDAASRRYEPYALGFVRVGAVAVLFGLGGMLAVLWRREARRKRT